MKHIYFNQAYIKFICKQLVNKFTQGKLIKVY